MNTKKPIDLKKQDFKWGVEGNELSLKEDANKNISSGTLSEMIDNVNQEHDTSNLSAIAKDRKQQRQNINSAVDMMPSTVYSSESGSKVRRETLGKDYQNALENVDHNLINSKLEHVKNVIEQATESGDLTSENKKVKEIDLEEDVMIQPNVASKEVVDNVEVQDVPKIKKKKSSQPPRQLTDFEKFKQNISEIWKSALGVVVLLVAIVIGVSYKEPSTQPAPVVTPEKVDLKKSENKSPESVGNGLVVVNATQSTMGEPEVKVVAKNANEKVDSGDVVVSPGAIDIPITRFAAAGVRAMDNASTQLSIAQILPKSAKAFPGISLGQWPNAVQLKDVPENLDKIIELFPSHLYKKAENFQESLVIYDKRSVEQEKFVRQSQTCYFLPSELNGNWLGVNFYMISYCFLNSQFIGFNIYTNNGSDVMKKLEDGLGKYSYFKISSVQKMNGFDIINIEQNQAYKILEDYRVQMLNNVISKK